MFQPQSTHYADFVYGATTSQPPLSDNVYNYDQIPTQQNQQQQSQQLRSRGPVTFSTPNFSAAPTGLWGNIGSAPQQQIPLRPLQRQQQQQYDITDILPKMEASDGDYEAQQALANGYAPSLEGPPVGEKRSSHAITEEYAKADPVYVEKTRRLPKTYSHYRPVLGDGNCGWRAIGFSYFECLISLWSKDTLDGEFHRLESLTKPSVPNSIPSLGIMPESFVEDFFDAVLQLFADLSTLMCSSGSTPEQATRMLVDRYNDPEHSQSLTYFMRPVAAAQLVANADLYGPFIAPGMNIENEKSSWMQSNTEIDYLGMTVLIDALMKPACFITEIVILERSEGNEVNTIRYDQDVNGNLMGTNAPTAYILYKPGHYDILYKSDSNAHLQQQVQNAMSAAQNVQVNRAAMPTRQLDPSPVQSMGYGTGLDMGFLSSIPGMSMGAYPNLGSSYTPMSSSFAPTTSSYASTASSFAASPYGLDTSMSMTLQPQMQTVPIKAMSPSPMSTASTLASIPLISAQSARTPPSNFPPNNFAPSNFSSNSLPSHPATRKNSIATDSGLLSPGRMTPTTPQILQQLSSLGVNSNDQFRQSRYVFERPIADAAGMRGGGGWGGGLGGKEGLAGSQEMQTRQFRESHHNEAHYDNKNFQPYMWSPGEDGEDDGNGGGGGGGKKGKGGRRRVS